MQKVLTAEQMRTVDRLTTERYGIPSILLMENAAHAVARVITEKLGGSVKGKSILILCGKGNNGGDGAALARILWTNGATIYLVLFGEVSEIKGDARRNFDSVGLLVNTEHRFRFEQVSLDQAASREWFSDFIYRFAVTNIDIVVDSIFGTGFKGPVAGQLVGILETFWTNLQRRFEEVKLISVDLPSGLGADESTPDGWHFFPDSTVTFTAPKSANVLPPASRFNGDLIISDIGSPANLIHEQPSQLYLAEKSDALNWLRKSAFSSGDYKNKRGHALVIAGSEDYSGAAVLAGNAAMRSGVGLVTLAVPAAIRSEVAARGLPDLIVRPFDESREFDFAADTILIGCGLDSNVKSNVAMFRRIVGERKVPVIVDAGALLFFPEMNADIVQPPATAGGSDVTKTPVRVSSPHVSKGSHRENSSKQPPLILTPHEGEFMRLLGTTDKDLIKDRVAAVRDFASANNVILVLKGERVLIGAPDGRVVVNPTGNSGLGKAGNGDTLAGILAGFVAQAVKFNIDVFETVVTAVYVAGMAGDIAENKYGKRVMTASDVRDCLTEAFAAVGEVEITINF